MTITVQDPGDLLNLTFTFTADTSAGAIASVTISATAIAPDGTVIVIAANQTAAIADLDATLAVDYTIPLVAASAGMWTIIWAAAGDIVATERQQFYVRRDPLLELADEVASV